MLMASLETRFNTITFSFHVAPGLPEAKPTRMRSMLSQSILPHIPHKRKREKYFLLKFSESLHAVDTPRSHIDMIPCGF